MCNSLLPCSSVTQADGLIGKTSYYAKRLHSQAENYWMFLSKALSILFV